MLGITEQHHPSMLRVEKQDGVGPVYNRPSSDKLHHLCQKKKKRKKMWHGTCDKWHVTCDMGHVTCDMWHVTCDMFGLVNILSKFQLPSSFCLWFMIKWRSWGKGSLTQWINELITRLFIEQPGYTGSVKNKWFIIVIVCFTTSLNWLVKCQQKKHQNTS